LSKFDLEYLATLYSKYPKGVEAAFQEACIIAARLIRFKINVYSPIAHTHPIAVFGKLDQSDHDLWLTFDSAMMAKADALAVATMPTWQDSAGVAYEIRTFLHQQKPVFVLDHELLTAVRHDC